MPRSGINSTYSLPPNTDNQVPNTPISSSMFNAAMDDIEQTFNTVQPEAYGGTGASTYAAARTNLGVVTEAVGAMNDRRSRIVNGDMRISQENGTTSGTTNGYYPVDQWAQYFVTSAGTLTVAQVASVTPAGSPNRIRATVTVADASLAAGEYWVLTQNLEGSNVADFQWGSAAGKQVVTRFGFRGPAGTYAVSLQNYNGGVPNRSYVATFTISAGQANTDTVQTIAVPPATTGTWLTADGVIGVTLNITLASGSTFQGAAGWNNSNVYGTSAVSNGMGTGAAVFELFDVGLKLDPDATGVYGQYQVGEVHPVYRSERYLPVLGESTRTFLTVGHAFAAGNVRATVPLLVRTCKPVTGFTGTGVISALNANATALTVGAVAVSESSTYAIGLDMGSSGGLVAGNATMLYLSAGARLVFLGARLS